MIKPKLWKYKSGKKKGKLRPKAKKYLSYKLKAYYKNKRIITAQYKQEKLISAKQQKLRIRKQVVYNCEYSLSIRAIQINGTATLKELENAVDTFIKNDKYLSNTSWEVAGYEDEAISDDEDKNLKDGLIYIEFNNRGSQNLMVI